MADRVTVLPPIPHADVWQAPDKQFAGTSTSDVWFRYEANSSLFTGHVYWHFDGKGWRSLRLPAHHQIATAGPGRLWGGTRTTLERLSVDGSREDFSADLEPGFDVARIVSSGNEVVVLATNFAAQPRTSALYRFVDGRFRRWEGAVPLTDDRRVGDALHSAADLWLAPSVNLNGVTPVQHFDGTQFAPVEPSGFGSLSNADLVVGPAGDVWLHAYDLSDDEFRGTEETLRVARLTGGEPTTAEVALPPVYENGTVSRARPVVLGGGRLAFFQVEAVVEERLDGRGELVGLSNRQVLQARILDGTTLSEPHTVFDFGESELLRPDRSNREALAWHLSYRRIPELHVDRLADGTVLLVTFHRSRAPHEGEVVERPYLFAFDGASL